MSIFKRKIVNENKINSNKERANENESVKRVVIPDFSKTNFYDISPDQMEIFIRQSFELAPISEKQLIAMTLEANKLYQKITAHSHIDARKDLILADKRRKEEYLKQRENEIKYMFAAFSHLVKLQEKAGRITFKEQWIRQTYGIEFDIKMVNSDFSQVLYDLALPAPHVVEKYSVRKVQKGEREEKLLVEIIDREVE